MQPYPPTPASDGEAAIYAAGLAVNHLDPTGEREIRQAIPTAKAAALAVKSRSESTGWRIGEFTGLPIALFQNWLYEKNRSWRFTDGTLCILWCIEFPHARSDYAKNHGYIQSTRRDSNNGRHQAPAPAEQCVGYDSRGEPLESALPRRTRTRTSPPQEVAKVTTSPNSRPALLPPVSVVSEDPTQARTDQLRTDPQASFARLTELEKYMAENVLASNDFVCTSYAACVESHKGQFFEGQLHHIGRHFDVFVNGTPLRVVVVGQEYGNGPARVTLSQRHEDVAVRTGLQKQFNWADLSRPYLLEVVTPTIRKVRELLRLGS